MSNRNGQRPVFLNLLQIRFPVGAIASIAHRVSGVMLFAALPLMALGLDVSLRGEAQFEALHALLSAPWRMLLGALLVWAAAHHVLAGIRHLLMDVGIGSGLAQARLSARAVTLAAVLVALATVGRGLS